MIVEKDHAGILIYEIVNGSLFQRRYSGYGLTEAKRIFKKEAKEQSLKGHS